jgi:A/G-specific adenine glycosylase
MPQSSLPSTRRPALLPARLARRLHASLLAWYDRSHRDLPWRQTSDPYAVWLSEVMLQQTRVETVIPYFDRFLRELPTVLALAEAPEEAVMRLWSGLGYYRRARLLHEGARQIVRERQGCFPDTAARLADVPGIGRYTAGAIASIAFGERAALVDGNVARVLARLFAVEEDVRGAPGLRRIWALADTLVPGSRAGDWNQGLMELGATTCTPRAPRCPACPVRSCCEARARGLEADLPLLRPRTPPALRRQVALVAMVSGGVVLARRQPQGLFGGLWEPPTVPDLVTEEELREAFGALLGAPVRDLTHAGALTHVLSHRRLETQVVLARLARRPQSRPPAGDVYDAVRVIPSDAWADLPMSAFARKVLAQAGVVP